MLMELELSRGSGVYMGSWSMGLSLRQWEALQMLLPPRCCNVLLVVDGCADQPLSNPACLAAGVQLTVSSLLAMWWIKQSYFPPDP